MIRLSALELYHSGLTVIPVALDGSKSPAVSSWRSFYETRPTAEQVGAMFTQPSGLAILGGKSSGGLEIVDFDIADAWPEWADLLECEAPGLLATLPVVKTPKGYHVYFRSEACEGNKKLAMVLNPAFDPENPRKAPRTLTKVETRGHGGYVLAPPSPAECHPTGKLYEHLQGPPLTAIPALTIEQRKIVLDCARSLNEVVEDIQPQRTNTGKTGEGRPGDDFEKSATWEEILQPAGWSIVRQRGEVTYWRRPGKDDKGISATTGARGSGGKFFVFSSNAHPFDGNRAYGKFFAHTLLNHGGDFQSAARELGKRGLGKQRQQPSKKFGELVQSAPPPTDNDAPPFFDDAPPLDDDGLVTPIKAAELDDMLDDDPAAWIRPGVFERIFSMREDKPEFLLIGDVLRRRKKKNEFNKAIKEHEQKQKRQTHSEGWRAELLFREMKDGTTVMETCLNNLIEYLNNDPAWVGVIAHDDFMTQIVTRRPPPYNRKSLRWADEDALAVKRWFERNTPMRPNIALVCEAILCVAKDHAYSSQIEYLETLNDHMGESVIDTWLIDCFGAPDTRYVREVGRKWLISAVARAFKPGCKVDTVLVLEGSQGLKKSRALQQLCPQPAWFTDGLSEFGSKAQAEEIEGKWIVELGELKGISKDIDQTKAFVTRQAENYRPAYARYTINSPRKCVFAGTVNPGNVGYLKDETGNRRFWPVTCTKQSPEITQELRDKLWFEARRLYEQGEIWWFEDETVIAEAEAEQKQRLAIDPWTERVEDYLIGKDSVSTHEIINECIKIEIGRQTLGDVARVGKILAALDWKKYRAPRDHNGKQGGIRFRNPRVPVQLSLVQ